MTDQVIDTTENTITVENADPAPAETPKKGGKRKAQVIDGETPTDVTGLPAPKGKEKEKAKQTVIQMPEYELTPVGITIKGKPSIDAWFEIGREIASKIKTWETEGYSLQWAAGAWMAWGQDRYGEDAAQGEDVFSQILGEKAKRTLYNWSSIVQQYKSGERYDPKVLSFTHHATAAYVVDPDGKGRKTRDSLLKLAIERDMSTSQLREAVRALNAGDPEPEPEEPEEAESADPVGFEELATITATIENGMIMPQGEGDLMILKRLQRQLKKAPVHIIIQQLEDDDHDYGEELVAGKE